MVGYSGIIFFALLDIKPDIVDKEASEVHYTAHYIYFEFLIVECL